MLKKTHIHGGIDIPAKIGSEIVACESGSIMVMYNRRDSRLGDGGIWPDDRMGIFPFRNYYQDIYGPIVILNGISGKTYIFAHGYMEQYHDNLYHDKRWHYMEQLVDDRYPFCSFYTEWIKVQKGDVIGFVGNSGASKGPHLHFEIHPSYQWYNYPERINPETVIWEGR